MSGFLYRYEDYLVAGSYTSITGDTEPGPSEVRIRLIEFPILKKTPKGHWIDKYGENRYVLTGTRKCFALPSKEKALESFIYRKKAQARIYRARLEHATDAILLARDIQCGFKSCSL